MRIAITDANIFIDIIHVELHAEFFGASLEIHTTLSVYDELNDRQQEILSPFISQKLLKIHSDEFNHLPEEIEQNKSLSSSDKSVFSLALKLDAFILTGDGLLRKVSCRQKIEVHGVLWLLDRFVEMNLITKEIAAMQLKKLMVYNNRLPGNDCDKRIEEWGR